MAQAPVPPFDPSHLERLAKILGDTDRGLTGTQIDQMLQQSRVAEFETGGTKWKRLYNALAGEQNRTRIGNATMRFIRFSLAPARWLDCSR